MTASVPRWLAHRAARLGAALTEVLIDAHGHAALLARLSDRTFLRAFAAALALDEPGALLFVLERGLQGERERLGVVVDASARKVSLLGRAGVLLPEATDADPHGGAGELVDEARLGALLVASRSALPAPFARLSRLPGRGPRTALALALLAELAFGYAPSEKLLALALGSASGDPAPVPLLVYDDVICALEAMLHAPRREEARIAPLAALFFEAERLWGSAQPAALERVLQKERRLARELCGFSRAGPVAAGAEAPKLARRPLRRIVRDPRSYRPASIPPFGEDAALEDLFLP